MRMYRHLILVFWFFVTMLSCATAQTRWEHRGLARVSRTVFKASLFNPQRMATARLGFPEEAGSALYRLGFDGRKGGVSANVVCRMMMARDTAWVGSFQFSEAALTVEAGNWVLMAGRSLLRWGTGYAYNPTDFMAPAKSLSDPENRDGTAVGREMIKAECFLDNLSLALAAVLPVAGRLRDRLKTPALVGRVYSCVGGIDLSVLLRLQRRTPLQIGLNGAYVIGQRLEVHGEARWAAQAATRAVMAGFQITLPGRVLLIGEAWMQGEGLSVAGWSEKVKAAEAARSAWLYTPTPATAGRILSQLTLFQSGRAMRHYGFIHLQWPAVPRIDLRLSAIINLHDASRILMPEIDWRSGKYFTLFARGTIFGGAPRSEYGGHFYSHSLTGGVRFHG